MIQSPQEIENLAGIAADVDHINQIAIVPTLLDVICRTTGMGFAAVARVTDEKWVACSVKDDIMFGLKAGGELSLETTICNEIRQDHQAVIIDHVAEDRNFSSHHTPLKYGFQSYISVPIFRKDGSFFGTLCAIDPKPNHLKTPEVIGMFNLFADLISFHLQAIEQVSVAETRLKEELKTAELREQFIAILGHDLRNPLSAISFSAELLLDMQLDPEAHSLADIIKKSSGRMANLIKNILDFARGRLGGGLIVSRAPVESLDQTLHHIVQEQQTANPGRIILTNFNFTRTVYCDVNRVAELLSNLLGNAITYGIPDTPVTITAFTDDEYFILDVQNQGAKIPEHVIHRLFEPFVRGVSKSGKDGLGLGLFIASEIAKAHDGQIEVTSGESETTFTLKMPVHAADTN